MVVALQTPPSQVPPPHFPGAPHRPRSSRPPPARAPRRFTMLAGRPAAAEGLSAPSAPPPRGGALGAWCLPCRLLQRGLAEFSVGEAHQASAVTAGPAYGSHLRGAEGQIVARWAAAGLRAQGRRGPAEAKDSARTGVPAPAGNPGRRSGAARLLRETCAGAASMRTADPPSQGSAAPCCPVEGEDIRLGLRARHSPG